MAWVKLDDNFAEHRKFHQSGNLYPLLVALQVEALCHAARHLTDGVLSKAQALAMATRIAHGHTVLDDNDTPLDMTPAILVQAMVDAGLWDTAGRGYVVHDYSQYQWTRQQVQTERDRRAERQRRFRARNVVTNDGGNSVGNDPGMGMGIPSTSGESEQAPAVMMGFRPKAAKPSLSEEQEQAAALARRLNRAWIKAGMPRNEDGTPKMPTDEEINEATDAD